MHSSCYKLDLYRQQQCRPQPHVYYTSVDVRGVYLRRIDPGLDEWLRKSGSESKRVSVWTWYCFVCKYKVEPFNELIPISTLHIMGGPNRRCLASPENTRRVCGASVVLTIEAGEGSSKLPDALREGYVTLDETKVGYLQKSLLALHDSINVPFGVSGF